MQPLAPAPGELTLRAPTAHATDAQLAIDAPQRGGWVAMSLVVAAVPKVLGDLDTLSTRLALPMPLGQSILPALTGGPGPGGVVLTADMLKRLDPAQPMSVIWLTPNAGVPAGWCAALTFKDAHLARQTLGQVGKVLSHSGSASQVRVPAGDTVWAGLKDRTLLVASSEAVLLSGGAWAQAQQQAPLSGQLVFAVYPQVLAKSTGKPTDALVAGFVDQVSSEIEATASSGKTLTVSSRNMVKALVKVLARPVPDLAAVRLIADVKADRGLTVRAELEPVANSPFATRVAQTSAAAIDPALPVRGDSVALFAGGDWSTATLDWSEVFSASGPAGQKAAKSVLAFAQALGRTSCSVELAAVPLSTVCSFELRSGVAPKKALDAYLSFVESTNAWGAEMEGRKPVPVKIKRSGQQADVETVAENRDPNVRALMKGLFGGDVVKSTVAVKKGHLVQATGRTPHDVLASYGKPSKGAGPIVSGALTEVQGADLVGVVDVASLILRFVGISQDPQIRQAAAAATMVPGLSDLRLPVALSVRGGAMWSVELRAPLGSLENIAKIVRGFMGAQ
jgi:hypothetical protein